MGERICTLRKEKGITQTELATTLGVTRQAVSKWESGRTLPDVYNIVYMAAMFDVSTDYILMGEDKKETIEIPVNRLNKKKNVIANMRGCIVGVCLIFLLPILAKIYQLAEFAIFHSSYTYSRDYIFEWPIKGVLLIAVILILGNILFLLINGRENYGIN